MNITLDKTKFALLLSLSFMGGAALVVLGLAYVVETDAELLRTQSKELAFQKAQAEEQFETTRLLESTTEERARLRDFVLTESTIIDFISSIETLAESLNLSFDTENITPVETKHQTFNDLTIDVSFRGQRENVQLMLRALESLPYHSWVNDMILREEITGEWTISTSIHITILES